MSQQFADVVEEAIALFYESFKQHADVPRAALTIAVAPGRVNLIGEHTDYNDGFVLPLALDKLTAIVGVKAPEGETASKIASASFRGQLLEFPADNTEQLPADQPSWGNYVKGVTACYLKHTKVAALPVHVAIVSRVPFGSGLSSSAAIEVSFATFLEAAFNIEGISKVQKALLCQQAEHEYCNVPCGIMDQFISSCGQKDCALLIDCRTKEPTPVAFTDPDLVIVVSNSNVKHELSGGEYKERVEQCHAAVAALKVKFPAITHLRDATMEQLDAVKDQLSELVYRRARHVITEDDRTVECVKLVESKQYAEAGKLMFASHESLQKDYEVSTPELDYLVEVARAFPGVYGARMTGGGFGGCIVALVRRENAPALLTKLGEGYPVARFGKELPKPESFITGIGDGAHVVQTGAQP